MMYLGKVDFLIVGSIVSFFFCTPAVLQLIRNIIPVAVLLFLELFSDLWNMHSFRENYPKVYK